jgi:hypothetical protein
MGKWVTGIYKSELHFTDVYVEDGQEVEDVLFPEGYEGEMWVSDLSITSEKEDGSEDE